MPEAVLKGRVALVTGVSRRKGIGFAILRGRGYANAQRLATLGADVFIHSFSPYDADRSWGADADGIPGLIATLEESGTRIAHAEGDFSDSTTPDRVMKAAVDTFGHVDILVANHTYSTMGDLEALTAAEIDLHLHVNVRATLLLVQAFAAQHHHSSGRVILLTSGQRLTPMPGELAYVASKGALQQLTLSLSAHLISRGITVNTINPGATDTAWAEPELYELIRAANPQGRWGQPDDAARLIGWLATDDAQWITGQTIDSNGGGY